MKILVTLLFIFISFISYGQTISGEITNTKGEPIPFASVFLEGVNKGTVTDNEGNYTLENILPGVYEIKVRYLGYITTNEKVILTVHQFLKKNFILKEDALYLDDVVVTGTRNIQDRKNNPVIVGVIDNKLLRATQSVAISDGLNYNPGVRVETNCQNCGFTQVRLNGLEGAYSQILINSRPIFSALNSVYGLDQIPANIVERIEVVRGGGSALYGSNAIAGTVNIITREPVENNWEISSNTAIIDGDALDQTFNINGTIVNEALTNGVSVYGMRRNRDSYDADADGYTELVELHNTVFGAKAFFKPSDLSKITIDLSALEEYRRGGDQLDLAPHFTNITEALDHNTVFGGVTYDQWNSSETGKWSFYSSTQKTKRDSYYGGLGGSTDVNDFELAANSYGFTEDFSFIGGLQYNHYYKRDLLVVGFENQTYSTRDEIAGFNRLVDQNVNTNGVFSQYEWKPNNAFTALLGVRYDISNIDGKYNVGNQHRTADVNLGVLSPRFSLLYKATDDMRFRAGYGRGFRAPQAFNEELHVSSAAGDQVISILSDHLDKEISDTFTASINFTKTTNLAQINFLLEGFYTKLTDPFTTIGTGSIGDIILEEVINGEGATVSGFNFEAGYSPSEKFTFQLGGTLQQTGFDEAQELFNNGSNRVVVKEFVRNPNLYGYFTSYYNISDSFKIDVTGTYTGAMIVPRIIGSDGFVDLVDSDPFIDVNLKATYHFDLVEGLEVEISSGFRNIFNSYQSEFDQGPERDSTFIFGPAAPRSIFFGVKIGNLF